MRKKRVVLVGLIMFTRILEKQLNAYHDKSIKVVALDTYYNKWDKVKAFFLIPFCSTVYSINGTLSKSRTFDWALFWKKRVMMTWAGTDVTKALKVKNQSQDYLNKVEHYTESPWLKEELKQVNIDADILYFTNFEHSEDAVFPSLDKGIVVLSYISKQRADYYGMSRVIKLAAKFPDVEFRIAGTDGEGYEMTDNVKCLGWVKNMKDEFEKCHITMRLIEHDGFPNFVLESLLYRKHVFYTNPIDHCVLINDDNEAEDKLRDIQLKVAEGTFNANVDGRAYILQNFSQGKILDTLIAKMKG